MKTFPVHVSLSVESVALLYVSCTVYMGAALLRRSMALAGFKLWSLAKVPGLISFPGSYVEI